MVEGSLMAPVKGADPASRSEAESSRKGAIPSRGGSLSFANELEQ
jgi:hypothetical protein